MTTRSRLLASAERDVKHPRHRRLPLDRIARTVHMELSIEPDRSIGQAEGVECRWLGKRVEPKTTEPGALYGQSAPTDAGAPDG